MTTKPTKTPVAGRRSSARLQQANPSLPLDPNVEDVDGDNEDVDEETTSVLSSEEKIDTNATNAKVDSLTKMIEKLMERQQSQEQLILRFMQQGLNTGQSETAQQSMIGQSHISTAVPAIVPPITKRTKQVLVAANDEHSPIEILDTPSTRTNQSTLTSINNQDGANSQSIMPEQPTTKMTTSANDGIPVNKHKKTLPTFNGDSTNSALYNTFKVKFQQYLKYYKVSTAQTHTVLSDALTGDAAHWFTGYTEEFPEADGMGYEELMAILDEEYLNPLAKAKYQYDYEQLKADYNEGIEELSKRIQRAAIKAGLKKRTNQVKKHKLFSLLPHWLQTSQVNTLNNDSVTYEEFKTNLIHHRELDQKNNYRKPWQTNSSVNNVYRTPADNQSAPDNNNAYNNGRKYQNNNRSSQNSNNKWNNNDRPSCDYCNRPNHSTVQCSNLLRDYINKVPSAMKFWTEKNMDEKLNKLKANNVGTEEKKLVEHKANNINQYANSKPLVYLNGRLNNYPVENILIDEGSALSIIGLQFYDELEKNLGKSLNSNLSISSLPRLLQADGITPLLVKGKIQLELKFNNIIIGKFTFIIVNDASNNVLVGRDITSAANLTILNDNGTKVIHGTDPVNPNIQLSDSVNIFEVNNIRLTGLEEQKLITNVNQIMRDSIPVIEQIAEEIKIGDDTTEVILPDHLKDIIIGANISDGDSRRLKRLLLEFADVFYKAGDPIIPLNTYIRHTIRLVENAKPIQSKIYSLPYSHNRVISEQITKWLNMGIITPSYSPWSTPCIVVDKKDQQLGRVCGDSDD